MREGLAKHGFVWESHILQYYLLSALRAAMPTRDGSHLRQAQGSLHFPWV